MTRAGLATDIEVVEEFPSRYDVASARQHRWTRGDWQLLPWILGFGARTRDGIRRTAIPLIGRWKLLDNLRRSLSAPSALLALLIAWTLPLHAGIVWTCFIISTIAFPPLLPGIAGLTPPRTGVSLSNHFRAIGRDFAIGLMQSLFLITFLAHQAWLMIDAMGRTLVRLFVHRRKLLEWVTAAQARRNSSFDRRDLITQIVASVAFAACRGADHRRDRATNPGRYWRCRSLRFGFCLPSSRACRACRPTRTAIYPSAQTMFSRCA